VRKGLFITATGGSPRTYEYHPLFREYLLLKLMSGEGALGRAAKRRAAAYLARRGEHEEAVRLYVQVGARSLAKRVVENAARGMRVQGRLHTLLEWERLLSETKVQSPRLLLFLAYALSDQRLNNEARKRMRRGRSQARRSNDKWVRAKLRLQEGWLLLGIHPGKAEEVARRCLSGGGNASNLNGVREEALRLLAQAMTFGRANLRRAATHSRECVRSSRRGDTFRRAQCLSAHWTVLSWAGMKEESRRTRADYLALSQEAAGPYHRLNALNGIAADEINDGNIDGGLQAIWEGISEARRLGSRGDEGVLLANLAETYSDLGRPQDSLAGFEAAGRLLRQSGEIGWRRVVAWGNAVALRRLGEFSKALGVLDEVSHVRDGTFCEREISLERLILSGRGKPLSTLRSLRRVTGRGLSGFGMVVVGAQRARMLAELGRADQACEALASSFKIADESGLSLPLIGEIAASPDLLRIGRTLLAQSRDWAKLERCLVRGRLLPAPRSRFGESEVAGGHLAVRALGDASLVGPGGSIRLKPKHLELLLLLIDRGSLARRELVEEFWGHLAPRGRAASFHTAVYSLRRLLGRRSLRVSAGQLLLEDLRFSYDVATFEKAAAEALHPGDDRPQDENALLNAIGLYSGPFAPSISSSWAVARREEIQSSYSDLCKTFGVTAIRSMKAEVAIPHLRRALAWQGNRGDLLQILRQCLQAVGRHAELRDLSIPISQPMEQLAASSA
jgi:DNA-binding SARP family transcriptional activator